MTRILHCRLITHLEENPMQFYRHKEEHDLLYAAVRDKRIDDARERLRDHIEMATQRAYSLFSDHPGP